MKITYAVPMSGCAWWRCIQPANMMKKLGLAEVQVFSPDIGEVEMDRLLDWGDVIVQQSPMEINTVAAVGRFRELGKTVIGDYDDLTFACSPFNPAYRTLGLNEVKLKQKDGKEIFLFEDGKHGFSIKANYFRYRSLQDLLKVLSGITTTNKVIQKKYSEFRDDIMIVPNSIDFSLFKPFKKLVSPNIRIGWTASDSHYSEIWMVKRIMRKIANKYGDKIVFVELGNLNELKLEFNKNEMEWHHWVALEFYAMKLAALNLDIGICPLDDNEFNRAKSQLKWSEYSAVRVPTVCSKLEPYDCVIDGETGMLGATEDEFFEKLCRLIEDKSLREKMGERAYDQNYEDYNLEKNVILWLDAFQQARDKCAVPLLERGQLVRDIPRI